MNIKNSGVYFTQYNYHSLKADTVKKNELILTRIRGQDSWRPRVRRPCKCNSVTFRDPEDSLQRTMNKCGSYFEYPRYLLD
ncbi:hypothetical protein PM082_004230 [Marasmius tenuissimus]|nr:hypothetical protein PM082_004230 [Marasmius tenuissimus]